MPKVEIELNDLKRLVWMAEEWLSHRHHEFDESPCDETLLLMGRVWVLVGKEPFGWFLRLPNWKKARLGEGE